MLNPFSKPHPQPSSQWCSSAPCRHVRSSQIHHSYFLSTISRLPHHIHCFLWLHQTRGLRVMQLSVFPSSLFFSVAHLGLNHHCPSASWHVYQRPCSIHEKHACPCFASVQHRNPIITEKASKRQFPIRTSSVGPFPLHTVTAVFFRQFDMRFLPVSVTTPSHDLLLVSSAFGIIRTATHLPSCILHSFHGHFLIPELLVLLAPFFACNQPSPHLVVFEDTEYVVVYPAPKIAAIGTYLVYKPIHLNHEARWVHK